MLFHDVRSIIQYINNWARVLELLFYAKDDELKFKSKMLIDNSFVYEQVLSVCRLVLFFVEWLVRYKGDYGNHWGICLLSPLSKYKYLPFLRKLRRWHQALRLKNLFARKFLKIFYEYVHSGWEVHFYYKLPFVNIHIHSSYSHFYKVQSVTITFTISQL